MGAADSTVLQCCSQTSLQRDNAIDTEIAEEAKYIKQQHLNNQKRQTKASSTPVSNQYHTPKSPPNIQNSYKIIPEDNDTDSVYDSEEDEDNQTNNESVAEITTNQYHNMQTVNNYIQFI